jgi:hypothetical protein
MIQFNAMSGDARIVSQGWVEGVDILRMSRDMEIKFQQMKRTAGWRGPHKRGGEDKAKRFNDQ